MNYYNITTADMMNGDGLRVVLWLSGCNHHCHNCQNPQTWDVNSGIEFDISAKEELFEELKKDYISGITCSGGAPLHENNINEVLGFKYDFEAKDYIYRFPVYLSKKKEPLMFCKLGIDEETNRVFFIICNVDNTLYAFFTTVIMVGQKSLKLLIKIWKRI